MGVRKLINEMSYALNHRYWLVHTCANVSINLCASRSCMYSLQLLPGYYLATTWLLPSYLLFYLNTNEVHSPYLQSISAAGCKPYYLTFSAAIEQHCNVCRHIPCSHTDNSRLNLLLFQDKMQEKYF